MFKPRRQYKDLAPDEIFLDSSNLPDMDTQQFEGRIEKPISKVSISLLAAILVLIGILFSWRIGVLQILNGSEYAERSQNNTLRHRPILPERGIIYDRNGVELAWNNPTRTYISLPGFSHLLGYIGYPSEAEAVGQDFEEKEMIGKDGVEEAFNHILGGKKGLKLEEVDAIGVVTSNFMLEPAESGKPVSLSIDSRVQNKLHEYIRQLAIDRGFVGGAGIIMDVHTGELLAITSYPEYDSNVLVSRSDQEKLQSYFTDSRQVFLDRAISGLYAPGSVFKPIVAIAALAEKTISPNKQILSTGSISIPNPYDPKLKTVFRDWKAHGWVDMRRALAVSSDVYFYAVGGGFEDQKGLGIANIDKYAKMFGLSAKTGIELGGEGVGTIPTPEWKAKTFPDDPIWRVGNTYHTAIGQYGVLSTPLQIVREIATIANSGKLLQPTILKHSTSTPPTGKVLSQLPIPEEYFQIVREGMRLGVTEGTGTGLSVQAVRVASKSGTAELGVSKSNVNSWITGFFPYEKPHYAFAIVMERGHRDNLVGGVFVMRQLLDWMAIYTPEYLK